MVDIYYNMETSETAKGFIVEFLELTEGGLKEILCDIEEKGVDKTIEVIWQKYHDIIFLKDISKIKIILKHYTTSNNNCSDFNKNGLTYLKNVLSTDNEITRFLKSKNISFDIARKKITEDGKEIDIINLDKDLDRKIYHETNVDAFLYLEDIRKYSSISYMSEFMYTLDKSLNLELENLCIENHKTFEIVFWIYTNQMHDSIYINPITENETDEMLRIKKYLLSNALYKIAYNQDVNPVHLKDNFTVPPSQIIEYKNITRE